MRKAIVVCLLFVASCSRGFAQIQIDATTKQDVEDQMQLTGTRNRIPILFSAMASQLASNFANRYRQEHPNANPTEVQKAATDATERFQAILKAIPTDEFDRRHGPDLSRPSSFPYARLHSNFARLL